MFGLIVYDKFISNVSIKALAIHSYATSNFEYHLCDNRMIHNSAMVRKAHTPSIHSDFSCFSPLQERSDLFLCIESNLHSMSKQA